MVSQSPDRNNKSVTPNDPTADAHGVILAGVHAWGESALDRFGARPLLPVAGRPLVSYSIGWLLDNGVRRVSICANSDTRAFRRCLGDGEWLGAAMAYCEDPMPRGPAGCLRDAALGAGASTIVVADGTIVTRVDLLDVLEAHRRVRAAMTVVVRNATSHNGTTRHVLEPVGVYVISAAALECVPGIGYQDIKEMLIPRLYEKGLHVAPYVVDWAASIHLTSPASYLAVTGWVVEQLLEERSASDGYACDGYACIHKSARVHATACLTGGVLVGPRSVIDAGAIVVGPTCIGADCRIGPKSLIRRSALWSGCRVGARAVVDDSVLACGSSVPHEAATRNTLWVGPPGGAAQMTDMYWRVPASNGRGHAYPRRGPAFAGAPATVA